MRKVLLGLVVLTLAMPIINSDTVISSFDYDIKSRSPEV